MKKILLLMMVILLAMPTMLSVQAKAGYTTLYAEDGRTAEFANDVVAAQLTVGWYAEPVQRLYAEGKSKVFPKSQVDAQLKVGWYKEPVQRLYAEYESKLFPQSYVIAQLNLGWYTEPVQRLYAEGKSKVFLKSQVAAQLNVGWYTEPVQRLYAPGKSKLFPQSQVAAQLTVGWYETQSAVLAANKAATNSSTLPIKVHVRSITFNPVKNVYIISGEETKFIGEYPSGAPMLKLGKTVAVELHPGEIVRCDGYKTTTIKRLYEDYYLSKDNQFLYYPMVYDANEKSFGNYGN